MNPNYYSDPVYPGSQPMGTPPMQPPMGTQPPSSMITPSQQQIGVPDTTGMLPLEQSYIENILRANRGKVGKFYVTIPDSVEFRDKIFTGTVEAAGRDHLIIRDPDTGLRHLIRIIYLNYADFQGPINYIMPQER